MRNETIRDPRKKKEVVLLRSDEEKTGNLKKLDYSIWLLDKYNMKRQILVQ